MSKDNKITLSLFEYFDYYSDFSRQRIYDNMYSIPTRSGNKFCSVIISTNVNNYILLEKTEEKHFYVALQYYATLLKFLQTTASTLIHHKTILTIRKMLLKKYSAIVASFHVAHQMLPTTACMVQVAFEHVGGNQNVPKFVWTHTLENILL